MRKPNGLNDNELSIPEIGRPTQEDIEFLNELDAKGKGEKSYDLEKEKESIKEDIRDIQALDAKLKVSEFDPNRKVTQKELKESLQNYKEFLHIRKYSEEEIQEKVAHQAKELGLTDPNLEISPSTFEVQRTDLGNAELFAAQHGGKIRHNWSTGQWLYYDGIRWNPNIGKAAAQRLAFNTARSILEKATKVSDTQQRKDITKWSFSSESAFKTRAMLDLAKALKPIECYSEDFDKDQFLLNLENGTLDLRTGELQDHNPDDMITKLAPVEWNGEVSSLNDNELWLKCLTTWMDGDERAIDYLKRLGGMCLTGSNTSRVFPIFHGSGKNGKNTFLDTLGKLMGDYATVAPRSLLR